jgi:hypothetical protein
MKSRILLSMLAVILTSSLTGCIVHTRPHNKSARRGCAPAHHWDGHKCVHNGKAKGHHKR